MLVFGICDDQPYACKQTESRIEKYMETFKSNYEIYVFNDGESLLRFEKRIDILFLDIAMPEIDGLRTAEMLNKKNDDLVLIFLTGYTERFQHAFKVNAFRYLIKPVSGQEFNEALSDALIRILSHRRIMVDDEKREVLVNESKILYVESIGDKSVVCTESDGKLVSAKTLKYWSGVLSDGRFIQTHKSYVVSFEHIRSLDDTTLVMTDGAEIPISSRNIRTVKSGLNEYIHKTAKGQGACTGV